METKVPNWVHILWVGTVTGIVLAVTDYIIDTAFDKGITAYNGAVTAVNTAAVAAAPGNSKGTITPAYSVQGTLKTALGAIPAGTVVTIAPDINQTTAVAQESVSTAHTIAGIDFNAAARTLMAAGANMTVTPASGAPIRFVSGVSS